MSMNLYAHPVSQPSRSIIWAFALKQVHYNLVFVDVLAGATLTPDYLEKFPLGYVPALEVQDGEASFRVSECSAILEYVAETHQWEDLWPVSAESRARVREWISWHHGSLRRATTQFFRPILLGLQAKDMAAVAAAFQFLKGEMEGHIVDLEANARWAQRAERNAQGEGARWAVGHDVGYLLPGLGVTLADIVLYSEVDQLDTLGVLEDIKARHPHFARWIGLMRALPHHDEVRKTMNEVLGPMKPVLAQVMIKSQAPASPSPAPAVPPSQDAARTELQPSKNPEAADRKPSAWCCF